MMRHVFRQALQLGMLAGDTQSIGNEVSRVLRVK
jgi:hypothetical protein